MTDGQVTDRNRIRTQDTGVIIFIEYILDVQHQTIAFALIADARVCHRIAGHLICDSRTGLAALMPQTHAIAPCRQSTAEAIVCPQVAAAFRYVLYPFANIAQIGVLRDFASTTDAAALRVQPLRKSATSSAS